MKISTEFSKYANQYGTYNVIQNRVADRVLENLNFKPKRVLDIGCGSGAVCKKIDWEYESFTGVDFAKGMLELHPKSEKIELFYGDFNNDTFFDTFFIDKYDCVVSASALQWAEDLDTIFFNLGRFNKRFSLAVFTSNTFKTLNETASLRSILKSAEDIDKIQKKYLMKIVVHIQLLALI